MSITKVGPQEFLEAPCRTVRIDVDEIQQDIHFDSLYAIRDRLAMFKCIIKEQIAQPEGSTPEVTTAEIVAGGNSALTILAGMESVASGAHEVQLKLPGSDRFVRYARDGSVKGEKGGGTIVASLGKRIDTDGEIKVIPYKFSDVEVDSIALTQLSLAHTVDFLPEEGKMPRLVFDGESVDLSDFDVLQFNPADPFLGAFGAAMHSVGSEAGVEVIAGGGLMQLNRVIAASGRVALGEVAY